MNHLPAYQAHPVMATVFSTDSDIVQQENAKLLFKVLSWLSNSPDLNLFVGCAGQTGPIHAAPPHFTSVYRCAADTKAHL